jgi:hypothetical protein
MRAWFTAAALATVYFLASVLPGAAAQPLGNSPAAYLSKINALFEQHEAPGVSINAGRCEESAAMLNCEIDLDRATAIDLRVGLDGPVVQSIAMGAVDPAQSGVLLFAVALTIETFASSSSTEERRTAMKRLVQILEDGAAIAAVKVGSLEVHLIAGNTLAAVVSRTE